MIKNYFFTVALIIASVASSYSQCTTPVNEIDEDFQSFDVEVFPQNCWTSSSNQVVVSDPYETGNLFVSFVVGPNAPEARYLVSPLVTFDQPRTITFEASGTGTIQAGTLSSPTDFSTFIPLASYTTGQAVAEYFAVTPVSSTQHYLAFRVVSGPAISLIFLNNVVWPSPMGCEVALTGFTEAFTTFEPGSPAQHCWTTSHDENFIFVPEIIDVNRFVMFNYDATAGEDGLYLVSPEVTGLDSNELSLKFRAVAGGGQIQPGTMATGNDFDSFIPLGNPIVLTSTSTEYTVPIDAPATQRHIAFKFEAVPGTDGSVGQLDNITLAETLGTALFETADFKIYPNPATDILTIASEADIYSVSIYDVSGRMVFSGERNVVDVSALNQGVYILNIFTNEGSHTTRFIKK